MSNNTKQKAVPVTGENVYEYTEAFNELMDDIDERGYELDKVEKLSDLTAIIYYNVPKAKATTEEPKPNPAGMSAPDYCVDFSTASEKAEETIRVNLHVRDHSGRSCCECDNYVWGRCCPYREGHVRLMDPACAMFNIIIQHR